MSTGNWFKMDDTGQAAPAGYKTPYNFGGPRPETFIEENIRVIKHSDEGIDSATVTTMLYPHDPNVFGTRKPWQVHVHGSLFGDKVYRFAKREEALKYHDELTAMLAKWQTKGREEMLDFFADYVAQDPDLHLSRVISKFGGIRKVLSYIPERELVLGSLETFRNDLRDWLTRKETSHLAEATAVLTTITREGGPTTTHA